MTLAKTKFHCILKINLLIKYVGFKFYDGVLRIVFVSLSSPVEFANFVCQFC